MIAIDEQAIVSVIVWLAVVAVCAKVAIKDVKRLKIHEEDVLAVALFGLILPTFLFRTSGVAVLLSQLVGAILYTIPFVVLWKFKTMSDGDVMLAAAIFFALPGEAPTFFLLSLPIAMLLCWLSGFRDKGITARAPLGPAFLLAAAASGLYFLSFPSFAG